MCGGAGGLQKRKPNDRPMTIPQTDDVLGDPDIAPEMPAVPRRGRARAFLLGAYTFLFVWAMAYLVLFFTDRLPT